MEQFSKDGRKLRPRKKVSSNEERPAASSHGAGERRTYGEHKTYGEHRQFGEHKPYGERRSYGENRPYGEHKQYGERKQFGEHTLHGERKQFGERKNYGEKRSFDGDRRPYEGEKRSFGDDRFRSGGYKKKYGGKPSFRAQGERRGFNKDSNEGIMRMIENSPRPAPKYSGKGFENGAMEEEIRLNKFIANSGVCSRREADTMIQAGVVSVNGEVVTELGTKVNIYKDVVKFNGETLKGEPKVYLVMNKPRGFVTTASDPHADKTVMDLLKNCSTRVYPVGRLDKSTTGVLMFTNDGEIAERLTHPSYDKKKIYQVILNRPLEDEDREKLLSSVELSEGPMAADALEYIDPADKRKLGIEIHSGRNRVVRRMFEAVGYEVRTLDRVYFAGLTKKGLKKGEWRYLTEGEVNILKMGAYA